MKLILIIALTVLFSTLTNAHSPSDIELSYDNETMILSAKIVHNVRDAQKHYIDKIEILVNSTVILTHVLDDQKNDEYENIAYKLRLKKGDKVELKASCSRIGSKSASIVVE